MEPVKIKYMKIGGAVIKGDFTLTKPPKKCNIWPYGLPETFELSGEFVLRNYQSFMWTLNTPSRLYTVTCYIDNNLTCGIEGDFFIDSMCNGPIDYGDYRLLSIGMSSSGQITCFNNAHKLSAWDEIKALFKWW